MTQVDKWREKYLDALDEQESLEKQLLAHADILRRVSSNLSAVAAGLDDELDGALAILKEKMRGASGEVVHDHLLVVEQVVRRFIDRREGVFEHATLNIGELIDALRQLAIDDQLSGALRLLQREVASAPLSFTSLPRLLQQLVELQNSALQQAQVPAAGFWQRLRGGRQLQGVAASPDTTAPLQPALVDDAELAVPAWEDARIPLREALSSLLSEFSEQERALSAWQRAKARCDTLLDWQQMTDVLDDVRGVLSKRDESTDQALSSYLAQLQHDLHQISDQLGIGYTHQQQRDEAAHLFGQTVANRVAHMHMAIDQADELQSLKTDILHQVAQIQQGLDAFKRQQQNITPFAEELQRLIEKTESMEREVAATKSQLAEQSYKANHDSLTELPNREAYNQRLQLEWQRFRRYGREVSIALIDIDFFKRLNDDFGHQVGDRVLRVIAKSLRQRLRNVDFVARYGGEEFVVLLPETGCEAAVELMDRTREAIAAAAFRFKAQPVRITFSCGVTSFREGDELNTVFERVDKALYQAKNKGCNCTCAD